MIFYSGPVETMLRLWRAAQDFELRTRDLEERILEQMLYTDMDLCRHWRYLRIIMKAVGRN